MSPITYNINFQVGEFCFEKIFKDENKVKAIQQLINYIIKYKFNELFGSLTKLDVIKVNEAIDNDNEYVIEITNNNLLYVRENYVEYSTLPIVSFLCELPYF